MCKFLQECYHSWVSTSEIACDISWKLFVKCVICILLTTITNLFVNILCYNGLFAFIYKLDHFLLNYLNLNHCIIKRNLVWKYHLILFLCNFIKDFSFVWKTLYQRKCSTKGATQPSNFFYYETNASDLELT